MFGASVRLIRKVEGDEADETISDRNGRFRLVGGAGEYRLVCHCGHERDGGRQNDPVTLTRAGTASGLPDRPGARI